MLIEFKVANFRSIREEQGVSLVASNTDKSLISRLIGRELPGLSHTTYLRGAALYGPNASGKSNVIAAFRFLVEYIRDSAMGLKPGEPTGTEPFKLDKVSKDKASKFEITFVAEEIRYLFGLSLTPKRITEEYLVAYPKGLPQKWYRRVFNSENGKYTWDNPSDSFQMDRSLADKTRENSAFLSVGPQFNHAQLTVVYNWFVKQVRFLSLSGENLFSPSYTAKAFHEGKDRESILNLLRSADLDIVDATIEEKDVDLDAMKTKIAPKLFAELSTQLSRRKSFEIRLSHGTENREPIALDYLHEESAGTRRLFALAGPWMDILEHGYLVFIDEIETSMHPLLVKELVRLIFDAKTNPAGAQIVFTTHSPALLDTDLMRRDQIWFTEKAESGATYLYPLTDYQPRKGEAIAKGYLAGRYGAVPFIPEGLKL
jgi:AAA15 family ATPase/GTPase